MTIRGGPTVAKYDQHSKGLFTRTANVAISVSDSFDLFNGHSDSVQTHLAQQSVRHHYHNVKERHGDVTCKQSLIGDRQFLVK